MCDNTTEIPDLSAVPEIPGTKPLTFLDTALAGVRQYHAVMTALDLGLFEILHEPKTRIECAQTLECRPEIITLLCEGLVTVGLQEKSIREGSERCKNFPSKKRSIV